MGALVLRADNEFHATISRDSGQSLAVSLSGELDLGTASDLLELVESLSGCWVTIDLEELSFVDVAGMSALSQAIDHLVAGGARVCVRGARASVRRVFALCSTEHLLDD